MKNTNKNCMLIQKKTKQGFSLVELLVVLFIMVVMTAVFFARNTGNRGKANVEGAARELASKIRSMQNESLNGKQLTVGTNLVNVCGYTFSIDTDSETYETHYLRCPDLAAIVNGGNLVGQSVIDLTKRKAKISNGTDDVNFYFKVPRGEIDFPPGSNYNSSTGKSIQIMLQSSDDSATRYVCVSKAGSVIEQANACP